MSNLQIICQILMSYFGSPMIQRCDRSCLISISPTHLRLDVDADSELFLKSFFHAKRKVFMMLSVTLGEKVSSRTNECHLVLLYSRLSQSTGSELVPEIPHRELRWVASTKGPNGLIEFLSC